MNSNRLSFSSAAKVLSVLFYKRYVDDIFCMFKTSEQAETFLDFLNTRHKNIKFTIEKE